jgi:hypothetical protein
VLSQLVELLEEEDACRVVMMEARYSNETLVTTYETTV